MQSQVRVQFMYANSWAERYNKILYECECESWWWCLPTRQSESGHYPYGIKEVAVHQGGQQKARHARSETCGLCGVEWK